MDLSPKETKLLLECALAEKKRLAFNAHQWDHAQIGSEANRNKYYELLPLLERLGAEVEANKPKKGKQNVTSEICTRRTTESTADPVF